MHKTMHHMSGLAVLVAVAMLVPMVFTVAFADTYYSEALLKNDKAAAESAPTDPIFSNPDITGDIAKLSEAFAPYIKTDLKEEDLVNSRWHFHTWAGGSTLPDLEPIHSNPLIIEPSYDYFTFNTSWLYLYKDKVDYNEACFVFLAAPISYVYLDSDDRVYAVSPVARKFIGYKISNGITTWVYDKGYLYLYNEFGKEIYKYMVVEYNDASMLIPVGGTNKSNLPAYYASSDTDITILP